eukprot:COSAG02_NODE_36_length_48934_cov_144.851029_40_plen_98_part_00
MLKESLTSVLFSLEQEESTASARQTVLAARRTQCEGTGTVARWFMDLILEAFIWLRSGFCQISLSRHLRRTQLQHRHLPSHPRRLGAMSLRIGLSRH